MSCGNEHCTVLMTNSTRSQRFRALRQVTFLVHDEALQMDCSTRMPCKASKVGCRPLAKRESTVGVRA